MITRELQAPGRWDCRLKAETPELVRRRLVERGHVMFFSQHIDPRRFSDTDLKAMSIFTGRLLRSTKGQGGIAPISMSGDHVTAWLGDSDGRGEIITVQKEYTAADWSTFITDILPASIISGTVTNTPGTVDGKFWGITPKAAIDEAASLLGAEYRVNDDGTIDSGTQSELYVTSPEALVIRKFSGIPVGSEIPRPLASNQLESSIDAAEWLSEVHILGTGDFAGGTDQFIIGTADLADLLVTNPYKDLHGNDDATARIIEDPVVFASQGNAKALVALGRLAVLKQQVRVDLEHFDISAGFEVGDTVYLYDPPDTVNPGNQVYHDGGYVYPVAVRVFSMSLPVKQGMGVVYRDKNGVYTDLAPYVEWETGFSQMTIGDRFRSPFDQTLLPGVGYPIGTVPNANTVPGVCLLDTPVSSPYQDEEGKTWARIQVSWDEPTNTDLSVIDDGDHYLVRYRQV